MTALRHDLRARNEPIAGLKPWPRNPRINDAAAVRLARTIEAHGWTTPILVQAATGRVIAGHTRLKAAQILGLAEVPVIRLDVDDRRATEIALADNRLGELAEWNEAGLAELLAELDADGDLAVLGWDDDEIEAMLADPADNAFGARDGTRHRAPTTTLHLAVDGVAVIERALSLEMDLGAPTRGAALVAICAARLGRSDG